MSTICEPIRKFWLPGINAVTTVSPRGLAPWITLKEFQIYAPIDRNKFALTVQSGTEYDNLRNAFASDVNRFGIAAIESIEGIAKHSRLPKASAWLAVRSYYGAFYAAHALIRMFGTSLTQFSPAQTAAVEEIANIYGMKSASIGVPAGLFLVRYDSTKNELSCKRALSGGAGSHDAIWQVFSSLLEEMSKTLLTSGGASISIQKTATFLDDLRASLSLSQISGGGPKLLPTTRNQINYQHELGTWYPYVDQRVRTSDLLRIAKEWKRDPTGLALSATDNEQLSRFIKACRAVIATYRVLVTDMADRCPSGKSFHKAGVLRLLAQLEN